MNFFSLINHKEIERKKPIIMEEINREGIVTIAQIPMRLEPKESSEMVSQILFGERYHVIERLTRWIKIECCEDSYQGWIDIKLLYPYTDFIQDNRDLHSNLNLPEIDMEFIKKPLLILQSNNATTITLGAGTKLPSRLISNPNLSLNIFGDSFSIAKDAESSKKEDSDIIHFAKQYLGTPYLWGGRSISGIDCSGLSQIAMASIGISIERDASKQHLQGSEVPHLDEALPGDLAFFINSKKRVTHVGIIEDPETIIHASGWVKRERITSEGIISNQTNRLTHQLLSIRRFI